ncbi:MAG TPA: LysR family transcriptional regulator [Rhodocyclaceae bacterium]|nr:LysR family transcriptional regulator [Rhodocyclaceae bacterium]
MNLDANDLMLFSQVADNGSFSRTAERAGLPKSTVSRRIAALEQRLGERLFMRSTRKLALTDFGQGVLEHARRLAEEVEAASAFAQFRQEKPRGRLRVSMPPDFSEKMVLSTFFLQFAADYPEIRLELDVSARRVDLIAEQFDLAIRIASRLPDDATLVARRLCDVPGMLFASPAYLAKYGRPKTPQELLDRHIGLRLVGSTGEAAPWLLQRGKESWQGLPDGPIGSNSVGLTLQLAIHGLGIALLTERFTLASIEQGLLEHVLPEWTSPPVTVWAVMPSRRLIPARTRVFVDALGIALRGCAEAEATRIQARARAPSKSAVMKRAKNIK